MLHFRWSCAGAVALGLVVPCLGHGQLLADSVSDFSLTQGLDSWSYGYYQGTFVPDSFQDLPYTLYWPTSGWYWSYAPTHGGGSWTGIWNDGEHPNGANTGTVQWAVRRWTSDYSGLVTISGQIGKEPYAGESNGTFGYIFVGDDEVWTQFVPGDDWSPIDYQFTAEVVPGETIDFALGPNGPDYNDSTMFTAVVSAGKSPTTPGPAAGACMLIGLAGAGRMRPTRRRR